MIAGHACPFTSCQYSMEVPVHLLVASDCRTCLSILLVVNACQTCLSNSLLPILAEHACPFAWPPDRPVLVMVTNDCRTGLSIYQLPTFDGHADHLLVANACWTRLSSCRRPMLVGHACPFLYCQYLQDMPVHLLASR